METTILVSRGDRDQCQGTLTTDHVACTGGVPVLVVNGASYRAGEIPSKWRLCALPRSDRSLVEHAIEAGGFEIDADWGFWEAVFDREEEEPLSPEKESLSPEKVLSTIRKILSMPFKTLAWITWIASLIYGVFVAASVCYDALGYWGILLALVFLPFTFLAAPIYALFALHSWFPVAAVYGGHVLGWLLLAAGAAIAGEFDA